VSTPTVEQLSRALDGCYALVVGIGTAQWAAPTPCSDWTVRDLVGHLVVGNRFFADALQGRPVPTREALVARQAHVEPDPVGAHRATGEALLAAFRLPGALERPMTIPFGTVPGAVALHLRITEALTHGWDLARATGQVPVFDDAVAEQELAFSGAVLGDAPAARQRFAAPQPVRDGAPVLDRLAALLGREV